MPLEVLADRDAEKQRLKSLKEMLHQYSREAAEALIERKGGEGGGDVQCFACGHRCLIKPGRDGVCRVRFNDNGKLLVPWGYVAGVACDPIEKKPFFHVLPGSDALTFGMLGCDFHCGYCFTPQTTVLTDRGPMSFVQLYDRAATVQRTADATIAYPAATRTISASGHWRKVEAVFRHHYHGEMVSLKPLYLPAVTCTPDHSIFATLDPSQPPSKIKAKDLTLAHYLAAPRHYSFGALKQLDVAELLAEHQTTYRIPWALSAADRDSIAVATSAGKSSREIGLMFGKSASYIRHVRSKLARNVELESRTAGARVQEGRVRFPKEHRPGIPALLTLDESLALLLGLYCAEGCVVRDRDRPNSHCLNFSFSHRERARAREVQTLLAKCLGSKSTLVWRSTTLAVSCRKTSPALLMKTLAGSRASGKFVPQAIFDSPRAVVESFVRGYVAGDGHRYKLPELGHQPDAARSRRGRAAEVHCTPEQLVDIAIQHGAPVVASSYNEPLITSEWAVDVFKEAKSRGLRCAYISNGNGTPQVLDFIRPHVDAYKVDLKTFNDKNYRQLGGVMENVTTRSRCSRSAASGSRSSPSSSPTSATIPTT
jgi:pyruvate-formate lyase-activating enzyme